MMFNDSLFSLPLSLSKMFWKIPTMLMCTDHCRSAVGFIRRCIITLDGDNADDSFQLFYWLQR